MSLYLPLHEFWLWPRAEHSLSENTESRGTLSSFHYLRFLEEANMLAAIHQFQTQSPKNELWSGSFPGLSLILCDIHWPQVIEHLTRELARRSHLNRTRSLAARILEETWIKQETQTDLEQWSGPAADETQSPGGHYHETREVKSQLRPT